MLGSVRRLPNGSHRQRVLPDRDGNAQLGAKRFTDGFNGIKQIGVFPRLTAGTHPVRRKFHVSNRSNGCRRNIQQGLTNGHTTGRRRIKHRHIRPFTHRHRFTSRSSQARRRDRNISHRHLVRSHHLIARNHTRNRTVSDRNQKSLVGDCRQAQDPVQRVTNGNTGKIQSWQGFVDMGHITQHLGRFPKNHLQINIDRSVFEMIIDQSQMTVTTCITNMSRWTTFPLTESKESIQILWQYGQHIALLRFTTPNLHRTHGDLFVVNPTKIKTTAGLSD